MGGGTTTGPDATHPPTIFQNLGGGPAGGRGGGCSCRGWGWELLGRLGRYGGRWLGRRGKRGNAGMQQPVRGGQGGGERAHVSGSSWGC